MTCNGLSTSHLVLKKNPLYGDPGLTFRSEQASWSWTARWFLCEPTRTHRQHTGTRSCMQKSFSSERCSLHFRDMGSPVTATTVCSRSAALCWCSRACAWHSEASQVRQVLTATDPAALMQWSQPMGGDGGADPLGGPCGWLTVAVPLQACGL